MALRKGRYIGLGGSDETASSTKPAAPPAPPAAESDEDDLDAALMARLNKLKGSS